MHRFDHPSTETLGPAGRRFDQRDRILDFGFAGTEQLVAWSDLAGMDQRFAIEAKRPPLAALSLETLLIVQSIVHAIEYDLSRRPHREDDRLQTKAEPGAAGIRRQAERRCQIVVSHDDADTPCAAAI